MEQSLLQQRIADMIMSDCGHDHVMTPCMQQESGPPYGAQSSLCSHLRCREGSQPIRGILVDLNGTLHVADQEVPGSVAALDKLRAAGIPCRFVTNTTKASASLVDCFRARAVFLVRSAFPRKYVLPAGYPCQPASISAAAGVRHSGARGEFLPVIIVDLYGAGDFQGLLLMPRPGFQKGEWSKSQS
jgi:hypothetical protein